MVTGVLLHWTVIFANNYVPMFESIKQLLFECNVRGKNKTLDGGILKADEDVIKCKVHC